MNVKMSFEGFFSIFLARNRTVNNGIQTKSSKPNLRQKGGSTGVCKGFSRIIMIIVITLAVVIAADDINIFVKI